jgi:hypothetical protein
MLKGANTEDSETHCHLVTSQGSRLIRGQESKLYRENQSTDSDFEEHVTITDPIGTCQ